MSYYEILNKIMDEEYNEDVIPAIIKHVPKDINVLCDIMTEMDFWNNIIHVEYNTVHEIIYDVVLYNLYNDMKEIV